MSFRSLPGGRSGLHRGGARRTLRRWAVSGVAAAVLLAPLTSFGALPAVADTAPVPPTTTTTVAADALPTVQINGVVWDQVVVGNTVYATGEFTSARPAGSPAGTNETPRSNILAYNLTTGALITSWAPALNAAGRAIVASADGTRIFVGGSFTQVNGQNRYRLAALDAATGQLVAGWNVVADARVRALAVSGGNLYLGGIFGTISGQPRTRLAAVSVSSGAVLAWAPTADAEVLAMTAPPGSAKVVIGGRFTTVSGASAYGLAALDATSGAQQPWAITSKVRDAGANAGIYSLTNDGTHVYGTGYTFGSGGNFEGSFEANAGDGSIVLINGCLGDTYDSYPAGPVFYTVSHAHNCGMIPGGNPELSPRDWQRSSAYTSYANGKNTGGTFNGQPSSEMLHWLPTLEPGTYTGQGQAAWTVEGGGNYVVEGGEFTRVNGVPQQGLVRFATSDVAPNQEGPQGGSELTPTATGVSSGTVKLTWKSAWDRDNRRLPYEVLRGPTLSGATTVGTLTGDATWWNRPTLSFTDSTAPPGTTQQYRIRVKDAFGNVVNSNPVDVSVPGTATNQSPTASFSASSSGLTASFDGTGSGDPDGSISSYAWDFGDGSTGTGANPTRTYAADGTYSVKLTVTDNGGATGSTTKAVTVAAGAAGTAVAKDAFGRTVSAGWGSADTGGAWTLSASGSTLSVGGGDGRQSVPAGRPVTARLAGVCTQGTARSTPVWSDAMPTGGGTYVSTIVRAATGGDYRVRVKLLSTGVVQTSITSVVGGTEAALTSTASPNLTYSSGARLNIRAQASGASPTTVRYRVWLEGTTEPSSWLQSVTDSTSGLQAAGAVGLVSYVSGSATTPGVLHFDNLSAVRL